MDEQELQIPNPEEQPEFDLDDIMKEFASEPDEIQPEEEEALQEEEPAQEPEAAEETEEEPEEAAEEVTGDTIRLDRLAIKKAQKEKTVV